MNKGVLNAIGAYLLWGILPIYWKILHSVPAMQITSHRVVWSLVLLTVLISLRKSWPRFKTAIAAPHVILIYMLSACILAVNWLVYIWGVNAGYIVETSLGYYINPLVSVLLGVLFLREKLRPFQWLSVALAFAGVIYLTLNYRALPWIALVLAFSFSLYALVKKAAPLGPLDGFTLEMTVLLLPAAGYLVFMEGQGSGSFGHSGFLVNGLLVFSGFVTTLPFLLFISAARQINLSTLGFMQYIAPTCQFLIGVLVYGESFSQARVIGFSMIWVALLIYSMEGILKRSKVVQPIS